MDSTPKDVVRTFGSSAIATEGINLGRSARALKTLDMESSL